jgi:predicted porin
MKSSMKKNLVLLCGTLVAGAACAQSSVTLFGIVDTTLAWGKGSVANKTQLTSGGWAGPRIGFRGTEDLGGGMKAGFWLEAAINTDNGSGGTTNTNNQPSGEGVSAGGAQGLTFARRSFVSLAGSWGEVRLGREYAPTYWNVLFSDPFLNSGVGATLVYGNAITGATRARASNAVNYLTPNTLGGFSVNYMHYLGENASNSAISNDGNGDQVRLMYDSGPITAAASWGRTKFAAGDVTMRNILAAYDFGVVKPSLAISRDTNGAVDGKGLLVGLVAPMGAHQLKAAYSRYKTNAVGAPAAKKFAIGDAYSLSKRTIVYATYARVSNSGGSATSVNGAVTGANQSSSGFDLGIAHNF